jgi:hypothetical protein
VGSSNAAGISTRNWKSDAALKKIVLLPWAGRAVFRAILASGYRRERTGFSCQYLGDADPKRAGGGIQQIISNPYIDQDAALGHLPSTS